MRSRDRTLYERMLVASDNKVVLIGWPIDSTGQPTFELDSIRRSVQRYGARHRYHSNPESVDPDSYMVIGDLTPCWDAAKLDASISKCRDTVLRQACTAWASPETTFLITYTDTKLPARSTTSVALSKLTSREPR